MKKKIIKKRKNPTAFKYQLDETEQDILLVRDYSTQVYLRGQTHILNKLVDKGVIDEKIGLKGLMEVDKEVARMLP